MKLQGTLFVDQVGDFGNKRGPQTIDSKALMTSELVCKFCTVAVLDVSRTLEDERAEPVDSTC